jgi:hypothetical protein
MSPRNRRNGGHLPRSTVVARQLTIGECAAIARYGAHMIDDKGGTVPVYEILKLIDELEVCTTCGWPWRVHELDVDTRTQLRCCAQHTRKV